MKQAVWTGAISFGLVNIPVKLYPATEPKDVRFHLYDRQSGKRVRYERVIRAEDATVFVPEPRSSDDEPELPSAFERSTPASAFERSFEGPSGAERSVDMSDVVRGFQLPGGDLVTVSDDEVEAVAPPRSRTIEIEEFVDLAQIDPVYFEKSYYVAPGRDVGAEKPYALLLRAMQAARMVAIGRFVLRTKPHLVAIRPLERALALETLFFGDEVRRPEEVVGGLQEATLTERERKTAEQLVRALSTEWVPEKHADLYRQELLAML
jgi:DNA end-binding protein Ku